MKGLFLILVALTVVVAVQAATRADWRAKRVAKIKRDFLAKHLGVARHSVADQRLINANRRNVNKPVVAREVEHASARQIAEKHRAIARAKLAEQHKGRFPNPLKKTVEVASAKLIAEKEKAIAKVKVAERRRDLARQKLAAQHKGRFINPLKRIEHSSARQIAEKKRAIARAELAAQHKGRFPNPLKENVEVSSARQIAEKKRAIARAKLAAQHKGRFENPLKEKIRKGIVRPMHPNQMLQKYDHPNWRQRMEQNAVVKKNSGSAATGVFARSEHGPVAKQNSGSAATGVFARSEHGPVARRNKGKDTRLPKIKQPIGGHHLKAKSKLKKEPVMMKPKYVHFPARV